ncbi:ATP-binding protein [Bordetella genomosp. 10]|uniref:ATP-binding protein n=1 Tax=Bordetella genomosp. 10 TaxID=1416804 RepID=UPI0015C617E1
MLENLTANAVAYGTCDVPILVHTAITTASFSISVRNEGSPIPEALFAKIFQPMPSGAKTSTRARSVGLGLFIVQHPWRSVEVRNVSER